MKLSHELIARIRSGMASLQELREAGPAEVRAVKADSEVMHFRFSTKRSPRSLMAEERTVEHTASNEDQDRMGDRISVRGWELESFKRNPVLLWDHNASEPPIGRVMKVRKAAGDDGRPELSTVSRFHEAEKNPHADLIFRMVADGDLPAVSVGFNPMEVELPKSAEEAKALGVGEFGVYFKRQELLELSVVTVPAHAGALAKKLEKMHDTGEYSWAVLDEVIRRLTGEKLERTLVTVPAMPVACEVEDALGDEVFVPLAGGRSIPVNTLTYDDVKRAIAESKSSDIGFETSARMIRSIVRDELNAALKPAKSKELKPQVAPTDSPVTDGDSVEQASDQVPETKDADLFEIVRHGLSGAVKGK